MLYYLFFNQIVCDDLLSISQPTVSRIVKNVSRLFSLQYRQFIKFPITAANILAYKIAFQQLGTVNGNQDIPGIIGAIDGTHIRIVNMPERPPYPEAFRKERLIFLLMCKYAFINISQCIL